MKLSKFLFVIAAACQALSAAFAQAQDPVAWWKFDTRSDRIISDFVTQISDSFRGNFKYVAG